MSDPIKTSKKKIKILPNPDPYKANRDQHSVAVAKAYSFFFTASSSNRVDCKIDQERT